jgi:superfamily I DNA/RNA helicase
VTLAYTAVRRKVSALCQDDYWNRWAKDFAYQGQMNIMTPHSITGLEMVKLMQPSK